MSLATVAKNSDSDRNRQDLLMNEAGVTERAFDGELTMDEIYENADFISETNHRFYVLPHL